MSSALFPLRRFGETALYRVVTDPPYCENSYIVRRDGDGAAVVVDPGAPTRVLEALRLLGGKVVAVLLTHGHPDHVAALDEIVRETGAPAYAHANEKDVLEAAKEWGRMLFGYPVEIPSRIEYFSGEPILDVGAGVRVAATPGHTPGGVCYVVEDGANSLAFTGDTLFRYGRGRTDFPGGDEATLIASISCFLDGEKEDTQLFPGHGEPWSVKEARPWWRDAKGF